MPHEHNPSQLSEGLCNVEVTERADFEECDAQSLCKGLGMLGGHLTLIGQVKSVPHQDLGYTWCMLDTKQCSVSEAIKEFSVLHLYNCYNHKPFFRKQFASSAPCYQLQNPLL